MVHDPDLLDRLAEFATEVFRGTVYRATRQGLDPLTPSTSGGRWAPQDGCPVLYTSLEREGALAEISFHFSRYTPLPSKPVRLHRIETSTEHSLRLKVTDLASLGIDADRFSSVDCRRCQDIGAAVGFLGYDGLIVPSARWPCDNLVLFPENHSLASVLSALDYEEIAWQDWAREQGLLEC